MNLPLLPVCCPVSMELMLLFSLPWCSSTRLPAESPHVPGEGAHCRWQHGALWSFRKSYFHIPLPDHEGEFQSLFWWLKILIFFFFTSKLWKGKSWFCKEVPSRKSRCLLLKSRSWESTSNKAKIYLLLTTLIGDTAGLVYFSSDIRFSGNTGTL